MSAARTVTILRELERGDSDAELLARFATSRDAAAFAELVRRHGPLVLGVCRRVTGHPQDAEDAFQATFLVLAKKAGTLRNPELLGNYLYGVAFRVASRARRAANRRKAREVTVAALPDPPAPAEQSAASELLPIVDQELTALAECYRDAIVLCDLRGQSREEAAAALGIPEGTLSSRLANGRKKLAARLSRRGVSLSVALPLLAAEASAAVPTDLVSKTCGLIAHWASGGSVPVALSKLASGGFNVRAILVLGAVFAAGAVGAVLAAHPRDDTPPTDPPKPPALVAKVEPTPQPKDEPKEKAPDKPTPLAAAPRMLSSFDVRSKGIYEVRWNATGTHLAFSGSQRNGPGPEDAVGIVWLLPLDAKAERPFFYPKSGSTLVAVADDGRMVLTDLREYHLVSGHHKLSPWAGEFDPAQKKVGAQWVELLGIKLDLPETHGYAFPGGIMKTFRTAAYIRNATGTPKQLEVLEVDTQSGKAGKSLLKVDFDQFALSANGKRMAVYEGAARVAVYDLDRGAKVSTAALPDPVPDLPLQQGRYGVTLSPDGRRFVAFRGPGRTATFDADTGKELPALEGVKESEIHADRHAFSGDGRLMAAAGTRYRVTQSKGPGGRLQGSWQVDGYFLNVWDVQTGKPVKLWDRGRGGSSVYPAFNPTRPLLAILEPNGDQTRVGFWDFAAEVKK